MVSFEWSMILLRSGLLDQFLCRPVNFAWWPNPSQSFTKVDGIRRIHYYYWKASSEHIICIYPSVKEKRKKTVSKVEIDQNFHMQLLWADPLSN